MFKLVLCVALFSIICAAPPPPSTAPSSDATAEVKNYSDHINPDGSFVYQFNTTNGINIQQSGTANGTLQGAVEYLSPEGEDIKLTYIADENGYQPSGSHLPTSPPIPENIARSLEYIQTHPPPDDSKAA